MNKLPLVLGALLLLAPALFSIFGFLASFELDAASALPWKIGYGTLFILCLTGIIALLRKALRAS